MSLYVDHVKARAAPCDPGKGCESIAPATEKFSPLYEVARAAWIERGKETRRRARTTSDSAAGREQ